MSKTVLATAWPQSVAQEKVSRMEQVVQSYVSLNRFMGSVLVSVNGEILLNKGYGYANLERRVPNTPATRFRLGSLIKQFTAAALLLMEEQHKLRIDDSLKRYFPEAPEAWSGATIFHLLTHTSGIPNFMGSPEFASIGPLPVALDEVMKWYRGKSLDFQPGEGWSYNSSCYYLLNHIIGRVSGQGYGEFLVENVFKPLGMNDSGFVANFAPIENSAQSYKVVPNGSMMPFPPTANAVYSTTGDLLLWQQGLVGGKLLPSAAVERMLTPVQQDYGFGVLVRREKGQRVIKHGSKVEAFSGYLAYYPDEEMVLAVLGNLFGEATGEIATKLAEVAHDEEVILATERKEIFLPTQTLAAYAGTYVLTPTFSIRVTLEGGRLMAEATHQPRVPMFAQSETLFFLKIVDVQLEFFRNEAGEVTHLVLYQDEREIKGVKQ